jgi:hypothetical protein
VERLDADLFVQVLSPHGGAFRLRTGACGPYCGSVRRQHSKSELVRSLLQTTNYTPFEIAELAPCSYQLVTLLRRQLRLPYSTQTIQARLAMAQEELREHRARVSRLESEVRFLRQEVSRLAPAPLVVHKTRSAASHRHC